LIAARKSGNRLGRHREIIATVSVAASQLRISRDHGCVVSAIPWFWHHETDSALHAPRHKFAAKRSVGNDAAAHKQRSRRLQVGRVRESINNLREGRALKACRKIGATRFRKICEVPCECARCPATLRHTANLVEQLRLES
jgi:hypothetical protein